MEGWMEWSGVCAMNRNGWKARKERTGVWSSGYAGGGMHKNSWDGRKCERELSRLFPDMALGSCFPRPAG